MQLDRARLLTLVFHLAGRRAKQLLESLGEKYDVYELDQMDDGSDWQVSTNPDPSTPPLLTGLVL